MLRIWGLFFPHSSLYFSKIIQNFSHFSWDFVGLQTRIVFYHPYANSIFIRQNTCHDLIAVNPKQCITSLSKYCSVPSFTKRRSLDVKRFSKSWSRPVDQDQNVHLFSQIDPHYSYSISVKTVVVEPIHHLLCSKSGDHNYFHWFTP